LVDLILELVTQLVAQAIVDCFFNYDDCDCSSLDKPLDSMTETLNSVDGISNNNNTSNQNSDLEDDLEDADILARMY
jgi:hypothetical protein